MKYTRMIQGRFLERPNRFIALVEINGQVEKCHIKNTGRCSELLIPGAIVWVEKSTNPDRKTAYDLIAVSKEYSEDGVAHSSSFALINMDSQAPNKVVREWLERNRSPFLDITKIKPECKYGGSRIDFYVEAGKDQPQKIFIEVKGVTLEENGIARFPDAPTQRGIKHMLELEKAVQAGYEAWILFVIQMKGIRWFEPNDVTHPEFGETLRQVQKAGVGVLAYDCKVTAEEIILDMPVEIKL